MTSKIKDLANAVLAYFVTQGESMAANPYNLDAINENIRKTFEDCASSNNALLVSGYASAVDNYKKMKASGHPTAIPVPEKSYRALKGEDGWWTMRQDGPLVAEQFVDTGDAPAPELIVAIGAPIVGWPGRYARGYNAAMVPDNAPNGYLYRPFGAGGPVFQKVIEPGFFAGMFTAYYQLLQ